MGRTCGLSKRYQPVRSCTFTPYVVTDYEYDPEVAPSATNLANPTGFLSPSNGNLLYIKENSNDTIAFYSDFNKILMRFKNESTKDADKLTNFTEFIRSIDLPNKKTTTLKP